MKVFEFIEAEKANFSIKFMCDRRGVTHMVDSKDKIPKRFRNQRKKPKKKRSRRR